MLNLKYKRPSHSRSHCGLIFSKPILDNNKDNDKIDIFDKFDKVDDDFGPLR